MATSITILDELPVGETIHKMEFEVKEERLTVRELITRRVHQEVMLYNFSQPGYFRGLVQPTEAEVTLNGYKLRQRRKIDWEKQARLALKAFEQNGFFVLVNDRQLDNLDDIIEIQEDTQITFMKLVPLVGG